MYILLHMFQSVFIIIASFELIKILGEKLGRYYYILQSLDEEIETRIGLMAYSESHGNFLSGIVPWNSYT